MLYIAIYLAVFGIWMLIEIIRAPKCNEIEDGFFLADTKEKPIQADSEESMLPG